MLERLRHPGVDHVAHVRAIDPHAEGHGGHHHVDTLVDDGVTVRRVERLVDLVGRDEWGGGRSTARHVGRVADRVAGGEREHDEGIRQAPGQGRCQDRRTAQASRPTAATRNARRISGSAPACRRARADT